MAESLKDKTAKGLMWGALNSGTTQLLNLFFGIFLGRLLSPADYGLVGVLSIFSLIAGNLQSSGFSTAVVNMKAPQHRDYNAVFWFNVLMSACLYGVLFFCAPLIALFFHQPELTVLSRVVFLSFFISSFGISMNAYMTKNMMQREMAIVSIAALIISGITAISMALAEHMGQGHDIEDTILTIRRMRKAYSPWNSKIYNMRVMPQTVKISRKE